MMHDEVKPGSLKVLRDAPPLPRDLPENVGLVIPYLAAGSVVFGAFLLALMWMWPGK